MKRSDPSLAVTEEKGNIIKCILSNTPVAYVNGIRRAILNDIPTLAIDLVKIECNDTVLTDERIAHRLGLIPLWSDDHVDSMNYAHVCNCPTGGCSKCSISCALDFKNDTDENMTVYDSHLHFNDRIDSSENTVRPLCVHDPTKYAPIPIARLAPGQRLSLKCVIRKGNGNLHAKYAPVSACFHRPCVSLELTKEPLSEALLHTLANSCPRQLYICDATSGKVTIKENASTACIMCGSCEAVRMDGTENGLRLVTVREIPREFELTLDTIGQIPPRKLISRAIMHLQSTIREICGLFDQL